MPEFHDRRTGETHQLGVSIEGVHYPSSRDAVNGPEATKQLNEKYKGKPIRKALAKTALKVLAAGMDFADKKANK
jgi:hypothetical protein